MYFFALFEPVVLNIQVNDQQIVSYPGGNPGVETVWVEAGLLLVSWVLPFTNGCFVIWLNLEFPKVVERIFGWLVNNREILLWFGRCFGFWFRLRWQFSFVSINPLGA